MDLLDWHALDAPCTPLDDWEDLLVDGVCTSCGRPVHDGVVSRAA